MGHDDYSMVLLHLHTVLNGINIPSYNVTPNAVSPLYRPGYLQMHISWV